MAFALPFAVYGTNTLLFLLYTWPFFLALLPVSVLIGILLNRWLSGRLLFSLPLCALLVVTLFWQTFIALSGW
ncbi:Inner membrane protein ygbE [Edwardsiella tarda]|nr:Inner membrane protein ygbE [Edwardsiella tarda]